MKVNVLTELKDFEGNVIVEGKEETPIVAKTILVNALTIPSKEDEADGKERYDRYSIALRISDAEDGVVEVTAEEVTKMKDLVGKMYTPLIVGRVYDILEGK